MTARLDVVLDGHAFIVFDPGMVASRDLIQDPWPPSAWNPAK